MKKYLLIFIVVLCFKICNSQNIRGFYVNGFKNILGNTLREDSLLLFAKNNGFNYLTLYDMYLVNSSTPLTNTTSAQTFAAFVQKAKTQYSVTEIGVAAENYSFFSSVIHVYNQQHALASQKVDVYNLEFEFWIPASVTAGSYYCTTYLQPAACTCDTAGAFVFYKKTLKRIDSLANANNHKSEAYFGFFNAGQGKQIVQSGVDRVLLSIYIPSGNYSPSYQYNYVQPRLINLASANTNIKVLSLYSAEPAFMQSWVNTNPYFQPYNDFSTSLAAETGTWKNFIQKEGIQWFAYNYMPKKNLTTGLNANIDNDLIEVYPNPVSNNLNLKCSLKGKKNLEVYNVTGKMVFTAAMPGAEATFNLELESGVYFLKLKTDHTETSLKKLVVMKD
ncbi:MAG: hypothetical protein JWO32_65 [Bacteroidetes bacterium]|nr:hypothetical protein [Bacteroidota bacterium]